ncbi:MAG: DUF1854 domain-containing protein [Clostridiales bacterium]|nr:DUF1854 domain-containing protein [Clostridiales bacterium]
MESRISILDLADVNYIDPSRARFFVENKDFLSLEYDGEVYHNIKLHRAMPFKLPDDYISVQDMDSKELFFIRSLYEFSEEQALLMSLHLKKRYYTPKIRQLLAIKEKLGYLYFDIVTDFGPKSFALRDATHNIRRIDDGKRIIILDVDGNRYEIEDVSKMSSADFRRIEPYLL